jgi:hypothetical protein
VRPASGVAWLTGNAFSCAGDPGFRALCLRAWWFRQPA